MGAVADGERGDTLRPRQRRGQRHRAADRFADEMKALQPGGVGHGKQVIDHEVERPSEVRRRNIRAPVAAHVEGDQPGTHRPKPNTSRSISPRWRRSRDGTGSRRAGSATARPDRRRLVIQAAVRGSSRGGMSESARMPASWMTSAHFLRSAMMVALSSAGEPITGVHAIVEKPLLHVGLGDRGAQRLVPDIGEVGRTGPSSRRRRTSSPPTKPGRNLRDQRQVRETAARRRGEPKAIGIKPPPPIWPRNSGMLPNIMSQLPATMSWMAGAPPR